MESSISQRTVRNPSILVSRKLARSHSLDRTDQQESVKPEEQDQACQEEAEAQQTSLQILQRFSLQHESNNNPIFYMINPTFTSNEKLIEELTSKGVVVPE